MYYICNTYVNLRRFNHLPGAKFSSRGRNAYSLFSLTYTHQVFSVRHQEHPVNKPPSNCNSAFVSFIILVAGNCLMCLLSSLRENAASSGWGC